MNREKVRSARIGRSHLVSFIYGITSGIADSIQQKFSTQKNLTGLIRKEQISID